MKYINILLKVKVRKKNKKKQLKNNKEKNDHQYVIK